MSIALKDLEYRKKGYAGSFDGDREMGQRVVALVREFTGREIDYNHWVTNDGLMCVEYALEDENDNPLTIPEKAVVAAFAWYCKHYTQGLKRREKVTFPKIIHSQTDDATRNFQLPMTFASEERAYMFAEVAENCFEVSAQVIETPAGWAVVASHSNKESLQVDDNGISAETLAMLQGACRVLCTYPIGAMDDVEADPMRKERQESPEARQAWQERHSAPLTRLESLVGEILARLDQNAATAPETPPAPISISRADKPRKRSVAKSATA